MTLDDLRVFLRVCEAGSLSAVARELGCTQSAVSQHVKRLERELAVTLVERRARGVEPTAAGRLLRTAAASGLDAIDLAVRELHDLSHGAGTVRVTTGGTTVRHFMAEGIVAFRRAHPGASLEFQTENASRRCFAALEAHQADLAWVTVGAPIKGIEQRTVLRLPWRLAVHRDDPLAERAEIDAYDLAEIRHVRPPENSLSRSHLESHLRTVGVRPPSTTSAADWDTAMLLAGLGLGHAIVPALPGWDPAAHPTLRLVPIPALTPLPVGWAVRQWTALTPPARTFADTVSESLLN